jgi:hypothetical protein
LHAEALALAQQARNIVERIVAGASAVHASARERGLQGVGGKGLREAAGSVSGAVEALAGVDLSGPLSREPLRPSEAERQAIFWGQQPGPVRRLCEIEHEEKYAHTAFTRGMRWPEASSTY